MREMVLNLDLEGAIEAFETARWKFFEEDEEHSMIKVEVPRGTGETYVMELPYVDDKEKDSIVDELLGADFIQKAIRVTPDF